MSEEIALAAGDIAYWRRRAEQAEQRARIASETYNGQQQSYRELETLYQASQQRALVAEADVAALVQMSDESLRTYCGRCGVCHRCIHDLPILNATHSGAALLAELEAARAVVGTLKDVLARNQSMSALTVALAKYDAAVKARSE